MEIFVDGGLFELILVIGLVCAINYIAVRKWLLIFYSLISVLAAMSLFFIKEWAIFDAAVIVCVMNSILFTVLLWNTRNKEGSQLIDISGLPGFNKLPASFQRFFSGGHSLEQKNENELSIKKE
jgi:hypothetical protein